MRPIRPWQIAAWVAIAYLAFGPTIALPAIPWLPAIGKATAATYVYEKDSTAIPSAVEAALNRLNRERKIVATVFEQDTKDGTGETPEQYKASLAAATQAGLPALVATSGTRVLRVTKNPQTEADVLGGVP